MFEDMELTVRYVNKYIRGMSMSLIKSALWVKTGKLA